MKRKYNSQDKYIESIVKNAVKKAVNEGFNVEDALGQDDPQDEANKAWNSPKIDEEEIHGIEKYAEMPMESKISESIRRSVRRFLKESQDEPLDDNDIMQLAQIVVKKYGHGNCIDLDNPQDVISTVKHVMKTQQCDEYKALEYMSGHLGGGWG